MSDEPLSYSYVRYRLACSHELVVVRPLVVLDIGARLRCRVCLFRRRRAIVHSTYVPSREVRRAD